MHAWCRAYAIHGFTNSADQIAILTITIAKDLIIAEAAQLDSHTDTNAQTNCQFYLQPPLPWPYSRRNRNNRLRLQLQLQLRLLALALLASDPKSGCR